MKRIFLLTVLICCFSAAYSQLRVGNNYGNDLKVTIGGDTKTIPYKGEVVFSNFREKTVTMECVNPMKTNLKFTISKNVSRRGYVTIEPSDYVQAQTQQLQTQQPMATTAQVQQEAMSAQSDFKIGNVDDILGSQSGQPYASKVTAPIYVEKKANTVNQSVVKTANQSVNAISLQQAVQPVYRIIRVVYNGTERCKVFSNIGGNAWQGLEFRGKEVNDSIKDNTRNSYYLPVQWGKDLQIGLVFRPGQAINEYANVRKRVNVGDTVFYINESDIKKMSSYATLDGKEKKVQIESVCKEFDLVFVDPENLQVRISLHNGDKSRFFKTPVGQFYLQCSPQKVSTKENQQTVYLSVQVTDDTRTLKISDDDIKRCLASPLKGINLFWEGN